MKAVAYVLLLALYSIECRKILQISKNANIDFINMESGAGGRPITAPVPQMPQYPNPPKTPVVQPNPAPVATSKPVAAVAVPTPAPTPSKPVQPVPVLTGKTPGVTTPGYGSVKQLVTFYDSRGQGSVIRPYSYSQAVKQG